MCNLQAGTDLINFDIPDSPSVLSQRNGRIRRLGSKHSTVRIHNYATVGSVNEKKFNKILKKQAIIRQAIEKSGNEEEAIIEATKLMEDELVSEANSRKK